MSNSSSVLNNLLDTNVSSSYSSVLFYMFCLSSQPASFVYTVLNATRVLLLLPLCVCVLHHGVQQWKQKLSTSAASISHSDCLTYHVVAMEMVSILGYTVCFVGIYVNNVEILYAGTFLVFFAWYGELFFHVLTSVERYLAVVHPIIFLSLKNKRGIRFRNLLTSSVWPLSFAGMVFVAMCDLVVVLPFCLLVLSVIIVSCCSLSVLRVLARPGPGDQSENRDKVDPSKQRALHTIVAILTTLLLKFAWDALWLQMYSRMDISVCLMFVSDICFTLPSSLVLPVLFLHRARKSACCLKE